MTVLGASILAGASGNQGYNLTRSLRFRSSASAFLNRTPASASNRKTFTFSTWIKLGEIAASNGTVFSAGTSSGESTRFYLRYTGSQFQTGYGSQNLDTTVAVFRDPSAWYHLVLAVDTTQATAANRLKIYVNGVQQAVTTSVNFTQNVDTAVNNNVVHNICREAAISTGYVDGYLTEVNFIDGQALTPSSFGQTSPSTGVWQPIKYSGTYGTNGFYLPFTNTSSTTTLGNDFSGNNNTWTVNNISLTSGVTYDSMTDVPTLTNPTTANYCTLNPLRNTLAAYGTISNANLKVSGTQGSINCTAAGTMAFSGKMYCEMTIEVRGNDTTGAGVGIVPITNNQFQTAINMSAGIYYLVSGQKEVAGTNSAYGSSYTSGDVIGIAVDVPAETVTFYKNNVSQGSISGTGVISAGVFPYIGFQDSGSPSIICNFGQQPFVYTPPSGFVAMNTFNLSTPTIGATSSTLANKYFDVTLYTGNGSTQNITNSGSMQPDFVWAKVRSSAISHNLYDSLRGVQKLLSSNLTDAEYNATTGLTAFNSNGFTSGSDSWLNANGSTYVAWQWRASNAAGVTNTAGSITSTVSANQTAGFSIVTYTGNGTNATVGHGLGASPSFIIVKKRSSSDPWPTYHASLGVQFYTLLNATDAPYNNLSNYWGSTAPSSTVFGLGPGYGGNNTNGSTYVAYCFAQVAGYSAFGSYTGNGSSDGTFVFTGFRPRFVMVKRTDTVGFWPMKDTARDPYNVAGSLLFANASDAEYSNNQLFDLNSNGFKLRGSNNDINASGGTYIYMAFAESPFKYANAR